MYDASVSEAALREEILKKPDDDAPRLVLADLLQARGDPLGELILVQCELARLSVAPLRIFRDWIDRYQAVGDDEADPAEAEDRVARLERREAALMKAHRATWVAPVERYAVSTRPEHIGFSRGLIEHVGWHLFKHVHAGVSAILEAAPHVRSINCATYSREGTIEPWSRAMSSPAMARIEELYPASGDRELVALSRSETLTRLRRLCLGGGAETTLRHLADSSFAPHLDQIVCSGLGAKADATPLFEACARIEELQMTGCFMEAFLKQARSMRSLRETRILAVVAARLGATGVQSLLDAQPWENVWALNLRTNRLSGADLRPLDKLQNLRVLDLANNPLGSEGGAALETILSSKHVRALSVSKTEMTDAGLATLVESGALRHVRSLDLRANKLTNKSVQALRSMVARLPSLRTLQLGGNAVSPPQAKRLREKLSNVRIFV